ncbi:MAG: rhomboid family intramembrane serine protease [Flavobacteriales bacterium TMED84]|nr:MAG: rhomboid family intramembrane serine protease [Flavobacteriales bacterium TMED84]
MKRKNLKSLKFSAIILIIIWSVKIFEIIFDYDFTEYGVLPRNFNGLIGILFSPLIHSDVNHLLSNSLPVIILCLLIFNFYSQIAKKIFIYLYFISGLWLWCFGRESFHIGASGLIYAMASFLFFSGILRKNSQLSAVALLVIFIYGGLFWGLFPIHKNVSWEGHLTGFIAGILVSFICRKDGPKRKKYNWEIEEDLEVNNNEPNHYIN